MAIRFLLIIGGLLGVCQGVSAATYSGNCGANGSNLTWSLNTSTAKLTISGTGAMANYSTSASSRAPWYNYIPSITSITIANTVTSIGDYAFYLCQNVTSVSIGTGVTSIGSYAFYNCKNVTSLSIPSNVTTIGQYAFSCTALTSITIPNKVTYIAQNLFYHCEDLKTVTLGNKVTTIDAYAFDRCSALTSITIPSSVTTIRTQVFRYCDKLTSITIPSSVTILGSYVFRGCTALKDIYVGWTSSIPAWNNLTNTSPQTSIKLNIPCGTKALYQAATGWKNYTIAGVTTLQTITCTCGTGGKVKIDNGTAGTNVTKQASCDANVKLTATASTGYHFVQWNDGNTTNPRTVLVAGAKTYTASFTKNQYTLTVQTATGNTTQGTVKISNGTAGASATATIVHGASTTITATPATGYHFVKWKEDNNTTASRSVTVTAAKTYTATFAINTYTLTVNSNNTSYGTVSGGGTYNHGATATLTATRTTSNCNIDFLQWSDGVKNNPRTVTVTAAATYTAQFGTIGGNCGASGNNLTWSFNRCTGVLTISGSGAMKDWSSASNVPWYSYRSSITSVNIGSGVTSIGVRAFYGCSNLPSVSIPSSVTSIGTYAFQNCTNLTSVSIPSGSEIYFYSSVFGGCSSLKSFVFPRNITHLGLMTFAGCSSLKSVFMPETITEIQGPAFNAMFSGCTSLKDVYAYWTTNVPTPNGIHDLSSTQITLHIPCNTTEAYQTANWNTKFVLKEEIAGGICGADGDNLTWSLSCDGTLTISGTGEMMNFNNNDLQWLLSRSLIRTVVIEEGVTSIGTWAFKGCTNLEHVEIPSSVTNIGERAFIWAYGLESIHIPEGVVTIEKRVFEGCNNLENITLPNTLESIGTYCFLNCTSLREITIPNSVSEIRSNALKTCTALTDIHVSWENADAIPDWLNLTNKFPQSDITLHVPCGTGDVYAAQDGWKDYTIVANLPRVLSGTCGATGNEANVTWSLNRCDSTLTISGTGAMADFVADADCPWYPYRSQIYTINIGDGVTTIGSKAFVFSRISSITIPNSVTSIGRYAFCYSNYLEEIVLPEGLISIGDHAFYYGNELKTVHIPSSVTSLGVSAFEGCWKLKDLYVEWQSSIPEWPTQFSKQYGVNLHVPCAAIDLYQDAAKWKNYTIEGEGSYTITVTTDDASMGTVSIIDD